MKPDEPVDINFRILDGAGGAELLPAGAKADDIRQAPEWEVRERWMLGAVTLRVGTLLVEVEQMPLLDFGLSLEFALRDLALHGRSDLSFSDRSLLIRFTRDADLVDVTHWQSTASREWRVTATGAASYVQLAAAAARFLRAALDLCTQAYPDLLLNNEIERLYRHAAVRELGEAQFIRHTEMVRRRLQQPPSDPPSPPPTTTS
ncbi:hypothetical protein [Dactylosporangium sp. NPDC050588]|uniref:hypothetical protein n=1 Tax=Dactylosporangium sp. NPDC050588 TaxID=3157211 RepID=UPI0034013E46